MKGARQILKWRYRAMNTHGNQITSFELLLRNPSRKLLYGATREWSFSGNALATSEIYSVEESSSYPGCRSLVRSALVNGCWNGHFYPHQKQQPSDKASETGFSEMDEWNWTVVKSRQGIENYNYPPMRVKTEFWNCGWFGLFEAFRAKTPPQNESQVRKFPTISRDWEFTPMDSAFAFRRVLSSLAKYILLDTHSAQIQPHELWKC